MLNRTSEWVSLGHPDKTADYISQYILDRFVEQDPAVRYALEVQIKNQTVTCAGEITSKASFDQARLAEFVKAAVAEIGYTSAYAAAWDGLCTDASRLECNFHIDRQSPDIARGVDAGGWGDQGIFWGMATPDQLHDFMPLDAWLARSLGVYLMVLPPYGIDIKTQVSLKDGKIDEIVVAAPCRNGGQLDQVKGRIDGFLAQNNLKASNIWINGTGAYVTHGSVGDCGTTGRKLAVDFYGGNCEIGGGSPWTKDGSKADLTLNLKARRIAVDWARSTGRAVKVQLDCRIGSPAVGVRVLDAETNVQMLYKRKEYGMGPADLIREFDLDRPGYARLCRIGLPYAVACGRKA